MRKSKLNKFQAAAVAALMENYAPQVAEEKVRELHGLGPAEVLEWAFLELKHEDRDAFFKRIGVAMPPESQDAMGQAFAAVRAFDGLAQEG